MLLKDAPSVVKNIFGRALSSPVSWTSGRNGKRTTNSTVIKWQLVLQCAWRFDVFTVNLVLFETIFAPGVHIPLCLQRYLTKSRPWRRIEKSLVNLRAAGIFWGTPYASSRGNSCMALEAKLNLAYGCFRVADTNHDIMLNVKLTS